MRKCIIVGQGLSEVKFEIDVTPNFYGGLQLCIVLLKAASKFFIVVKLLVFKRNVLIKLFMSLLILVTSAKSLSQRLGPSLHL